MGIHGLMKLISDECPEAIREVELEALTGRKVAVDASMAMYQFLVAVRSGAEGRAAQMLTNEAGEVTSHIQGMFNRTIKMLSAGVKPVYIFDGRPPALKSEELAKRFMRRNQAQKDLERAQEEGNQEDIDKYNKRLVKVTKQHNEDCKTLLKLMGVPVLDAPCEAEAQCAELAREGVVYGTATEDMDALTFRTPKLLRRMTFSAAVKQPIVEVDYNKMLAGLNLTHEQFVDLCILCGCDYCSSIRGVGPKTALKYIRQYRSLEKIVEMLQRDKTKPLPSDWRVQRIPKSISEKLEKREYRSFESETAINEGEDTASIPMEEQAPDAVVKSDEDGENVPPPAATPTATAPDGVAEGDSEKVHSDPIPVVAVATGGPAGMGDDEEVPINVHEEDDGEDGEGPVEDDVPLEIAEGEEVEEVAPLFVQARVLFITPDVVKASDVHLSWSEPDEAGLLEFLVTKMGFNAARVANGIKKLKDARGLTSQKRMDSFFQTVSAPSSNSSTPKRKAEAKPSSNKKARAAKPPAKGSKRR